MAENILEIVLSKTLYYVLCHFAGVKVTCSVLGSKTCIGAVGKCVYFSAFFGSLVAGSELRVLKASKRSICIAKTAKITGVRRHSAAVMHTIIPC